MFAILGGDDPGRVHWAPAVLEKARDFGLILLDDGRLIDTTHGETVPAGTSAVGPSAPADLAYIREPGIAEMTGNVVRAARTARKSLPVPGVVPGVLESTVIGPGTAADGFAPGPIATPHGFTLRNLALDAGARTPMHTRNCVEVLLVHRGRVLWRNDHGESVELEAGDSFTVPRQMIRQLEALSAAELFVVRGGDDS